MFYLLVGGRLLDCLISETIVSNLVECGQWCLGHGCQSLNYGTNEPNGLFQCELNNCTNTDDLMFVDRKFDYYEMVRGQWRASVFSITFFGAGHGEDHALCTRLQQSVQVTVQNRFVFLVLKLNHLFR